MNGKVQELLSASGKQRLPPGESGKAYALESLCGEIIYIPGSRSATRLLVTGKESENAFALVGSGGSESNPIGFHFHREAHDVFLCLQGSVNVWAGTKCRTLTAGDFASVPPGVIHQYQILGNHTEFIGLIVPGGWEEFFRFIGEPYAGPMWPLQDERNPFEVLIPKLKAAAEIFDMVPQPYHPHFDPQPWDETDVSLPDQLAAYFLRAGRGPAFMAEGWILRPLATTRESNGRFAIASLEGSSWHKNELLGTPLVFSDIHHAFHVAQGEIAIRAGEQSVKLSVGETIYVPKGSQLAIQFVSRYAQAYVFANGGGLIELLADVGRSCELPVIVEQESSLDEETFNKVLQKHGTKNMCNGK